MTTYWAETPCDKCGVMLRIPHRRYVGTADGWKWVDCEGSGGKRIQLQPTEPDSPIRDNCCADWPKPCSYHEGWLDGTDIALAGGLLLQETE